MIILPGRGRGRQNRAIIVGYVQTLRTNRNFLPTLSEEGAQD